MRPTGPLLYHYADMPGEISIELAYDELRAAAVAVGFVFEACTRLAARRRSRPARWLTDRASTGVHRRSAGPSVQRTLVIHDR